MDHYKIISRLGSGMSGCVVLVKDKRNNENYVLKKVECSDETIANKALKEYLQLMSCSKYSFVQKCHEVFVAWDTKNCAVFLCIVAEYFPKGNLAKFLATRNKIDANVLLRWIGQLLNGIIHLHGDGIIHRNIKPSNVFIRDDETIVFGDFGIITLLNEPCIQNRLHEGGDSIWSSPETLQSATYEERSDVWSLGCLLVALLSCGWIISVHEDRLHVSLYHLKSNPVMLDDLLDNIKHAHGEEPSSLLRSILRNNVHQRPTAFELYDHPFIVQCLTMIESDFLPTLLNDSADEEGIILVKLLKAKKSVDSQISLLKELIGLAHREGKERSLKSSATTEHILSILHQHSSIADIQILGLTSLYLTGNDQNLHSINLIRLITNAIKEHYTNKDLLIIAIKLLTELSMKNEDVRELVIDSELVLNLLKSVKHHSNSSDLLVVFCILLMTLITDDHVSNIVVASGIIEVIVNTLQSSNLVNMELINAVLPVFAYISTSDKYIPYLLAKGIPTLIINVMNQHKQDVTMLKFCCFILQSMCDIQVDCIYYIADPKTTKQGLKCLLDTLKTHTNNEEIVEPITKLLTIISRNDDIVYELSTLDITTSLSLVLQQFHNSEQIRKQVQKLITSYLDEQ